VIVPGLAFQRAVAGRHVRVGVFGRFGSGNLGNEGSLQALLRELADRHPDWAVDFFCSGPEEIRARHGVPAAHMRWSDAKSGGSAAAPMTAKLRRGVAGAAADVVRTVAWVRRHDLVVVPGTGVLEATLPVRPWQLPWSLFLLCAAGRLTGVPVALLSVGASDIPGPLCRWLLSCAARLARYRTVRDSYSLQAARRMGVRGRLDICPDLAFCLPTPSVEVEPGTVGIGVMAFYGASREDGRAELHQAYREHLLALVGWLLGRGCSVRLFTGDPADKALVDAVFADAGERHRELAAERLHYEPVDSFEELMAQLAATEIVVATRYHNVLGALKCGRPTIALGYGAKHRELMEQLGMPEFYQDIRHLDPVRLREQFARLADRPARYERLLAERNRIIRAEASGQWAVLDALVRHGMVVRTAGSRSPLART
jgi:polysaccharide pyruvyl transferase WcaK-like protein